MTDMTHLFAPRAMAGTAAAQPGTAPPSKIPEQRRAAGPIPEQRGTGDRVPSQREIPSQAPVAAPRSPRVLLVEPERIAREELRARLVNIGVDEVVVAASADAARDCAVTEPPGDVALVSLSLGAAAPVVIRLLREHGWDRVLTLTPAGDIGSIMDALGAGGTGVLVGRRSPVAKGSTAAVFELSAREVEVLRLVADGRSNKWIGDELSLSALTVKSHLARIGRKLGTGDRAHMVALAMRSGVVA